MRDLENRIKKLEQRPEADKPRATIIYIYDSKSDTATEAAKQKAIVEYRVKHPGWQPSPTDLYIQVRNAETKELTEQLIAGEGIKQ